MIKSKFDALASKGKVRYTKTLTKVTFSREEDFETLLNELKSAETPHKVSDLTVTVKTNDISSYADLAHFILTGELSK